MTDTAHPAPQAGQFAVRNLVICLDGTSNEPGKANTNVMRLFQALVQDPARQLAYYDPGVGTLPEPTLRSSLAKRFSTLGGQAFGWGLTRNLEEAYTFLMNNWQRDDRVYLFGFSRGAYTIRVLASLLRQIGLLPPGQIQLLPYALRLFNSVRSDDRNAAKGAEQHNPYWRLCGTFRNDFAQDVGRNTRHFPVHFVGAWDTVSSYGRVWDPRPFPFTRANPSVATVRHAVALDERRWFFQQNLFAKTLRDPTAPGAQRTAQDMVELWFPGVHSDVGGGYGDEAEEDASSERPRGLWRVAFEWMLREAEANGLLLDRERLERARRPPPAPAEPWRGQAHESLTLRWWPAQFFPKLTYSEATGKTRPRIGGRGCRRAAGAVLHASVLRRVRSDAKYRPRSLPAATIQDILALPAVQDDTTMVVKPGGCQ